MCAAVAYADAQVTGAGGQQIDTTDIYGERADSLDAAVFVSRQAGNYLSKGNPHGSDLGRRSLQNGMLQSCGKLREFRKCNCWIFRCSYRCKTDPTSRTFRSIYTDA